MDCCAPVILRQRSKHVTKVYICQMHHQVDLYTPFTGVVLDEASGGFLDPVGVIFEAFASLAAFFSSFGLWASVWVVGCAFDFLFRFPLLRLDIV